jgi:hypothetical protein
MSHAHTHKIESMRGFTRSVTLILLQCVMDVQYYTVQRVDVCAMWEDVMDRKQS